MKGWCLIFLSSSSTLSCGEGMSRYIRHLRVGVSWRGVAIISMLLNIFLMGAIAYLYAYPPLPPSVRQQLVQMQQEIERLRHEIEEMRRMAPTYPVKLTFYPNGTQFAYSYAADYIPGELTVSGLLGVPPERWPLNITITFVIYPTPSRSDLDYYLDWYRGATLLNVNATADSLRCPWVLWPVIIRNPRPGDWISIRIYIFVQGFSGKVPVIAEEAWSYILIKVV